MSNGSPITSRVNPRRHDLLLPLSAAIVLHLAIAATLLWLTTHGPQSPPRPLEVSLVEVETPHLHEPVVPPPPSPPRAKPVMQQGLPPATPPIILYTNTPLTETALQATPPPAAETVPDAQTASLAEPEAPVQAQTQEAIDPPRYDAAYLSNPVPSYPPLAKRLRIEGRVIIRVLVDSSGKLGQVELAQSSGTQVLDDAALHAVKHWLFVPAQQGDRSIEAWVDVPIRFHLE